MFDKKLLIETIDSALSARDSLHADLQELNSYTKADDDVFCKRTDEIEKLKSYIGQNDFVLKSDYIRLAADFDNYRKRIAKEKTDIINSANKDIIVDLLTISDDMERLLKSENSEGFRLIYMNVQKLLNDEGCFKLNVKPGDKFDVSKHDAILAREANPGEFFKDNDICEIFQDGYALNGKVIRPAKVITIQKNV